MKITLIENQKKNITRKSVYLDGKYAFGIDEEDCFRLHLQEGQEIDAERLNETVMRINVSKAKKIALKYILFKMRTEVELRLKLREQGYEDDIVDKVLENFKELGYVEDNIYVERYIRDAVSLKKQGLNRIRFDLESRGIHKSIIEAKLMTFEYNEEEKLKPLIEKKLKTYKIKDKKELNKLKTYFIRKGYNSRSIDIIIRQFMEF